MSFKDSIGTAARTAGEKARATPRRRLALRVLGGIVVAVAIFGIAGYFGGPPLVKYLVEKQATEALGRKVTLGAAQVRPFDLAATLNDLTIFEPDGTTPMVTLGEVDANASIASLWHLAPVVHSLHVDRLSVHVVRDAQGRMNFADVEEKFAAMPPKPADSKPARFSISNIAVTNSTFVYEDKPRDTTQRVENFTLTLPFLSNLPHDATINTRPTLFAKINGSPLSLDGTTQPFADTRETNLNVNLDALEVPTYMAFAPRLKDAEIKGGLVDTRLVVGFRQDKDKQDLFVSGTVVLRDADVVTHAGAPIVKAGRLAIDLDRVEPLANRAAIRSIDLEGLALQAIRRADGSLNLATAFLPESAPTPKATPAAPAPAPASAPAASASAPAAAQAPAPAPAEPFSYAIQRITLKDAKLGFQDELAPSGPGKLDIGPVNVEIADLASTGDKPAQLDAKVTIADGQTLDHKGQLALRQGTLAGTLKTTGLRPQGFAAWWPRELQSQFGETGINAELNYRMAWTQPTFQFVLEKSRLELSPVYVATREPIALPAAPAGQGDDAAAASDGANDRANDRARNGARRDGQRAQRGNVQAAQSAQAAQAGQGTARKRTTQAQRRVADIEGAQLPLVRAEKLVLEDINLDLAKQTFDTSAVSLVQPQIAATRDHRGQLLEMARIWAVQSAQEKAAPARPAAASGAPQGTGAATARTNGATNGTANGTANGSAAARGTATPPGWKVRIGKINVDGGAARLADYEPAEANRGRPVIHQYRNIGFTGGTVTWPLANAAIPVKLHAESGRRGVIGLEGSLLPAAPGAQMQLDVRELDIAPLQPYIADRFNAALRGGTMTVKGKLDFNAPAGKPIVAHFAGNALAGNVRTVDRISGDDFLRWRSLAVTGIDFAMDESKGPMRVGVNNVALSDFYARVILNANGRLNLQDVMAGGSDRGQPAPSTSLTQASPASAPAASAPAAAPATATVAKEGKAGPAPQIRLGGVSINKGNINFSDFFVKPNYSANLTDMKGSISKVSSSDPTPADIVLNGRLDDDAPVSISGKLNPLGEQLFLDIAAKAAGVELTRLTPYAAKYAGYPITKGKLTVDVGYKIENGRLDARNHLYLDQLTFGDRVDSPDATKLPVLLAVSLLKDRNGVIDVNLPVSGSLSDPEFSIGGVIVRVIVNLLTKAITSPFSLIASAFGGSGDELGYIEFAPGSATLSKEAQEKIATVAKALNDRPSLRLEISGRIDPATDADGARRVWLDQRVAEQKERELRRSARSGGQADEEEGGEQGAKITVSRQEYPKYLEAVYKRQSFKKPTNMIGLNKSLPTAEMEKLLLENAPVTDTELRQLADQRALAVKQALERDGKVPDSKLFLTAPKLNAEGIKDKGGPNRVDFSIRQ